MLFAYFGPDTFLPVTSIIATAVGVFLMFGRRSIRYLAAFLLPTRPRVARRMAPRTPHSPADAGAESVAEPSAEVKTK